METKSKLITGVIYKFQNKLNNKIYIGQSREEKRRYERHVNCKEPLYELDRAIKCYGIENFTYEIIESFESYNIDEVNTWMDEREEYYIKEFNSLYPNGYNLLSNRKHPEFSEITKERISTSCLGVNNGFYGKKHSEETRKRMSESAKRRGNNNSYEKIRAIDYYKDNEFICTFINFKECKEYFKGICGDKIIRKLLNNIPVNKKLDNIRLVYSNKPGHRSVLYKPRSEESKKKMSESMKKCWSNPEYKKKMSLKFSEMNKGRVSWSKGKTRPDQSSIMKNRIYINNGIIRKMVKKEELDKYLNDGYRIGFKLDNY